MKILIVEPHTTPYEADIGSDLKSMQRIVGGRIEAIDLDRKTVLVCNEEGKCIGLEGNRRMDNNDIIAGTFFICGCNNRGGFCSLTDEQVARYTERFKEDEHYTDDEVSDCEYIEFRGFDGF